ncbi:hypothetical protein GTA08_BOTSDO04047 [Botryosphaeria dothidea]|uniref:Uncharacterized protein n=1 Tax=Botryosphaeria dothidea TaxID=55169 RepID=A0A8H4IW25_9PEZI|nr:hypothetical protein GTA08_BOTSDO04047 [Botryosphaeria dothidea]
MDSNFVPRTTSPHQRNDSTVTKTIGHENTSTHSPSYKPFARDIPSNRARRTVDDYVTLIADARRPAGSNSSGRSWNHLTFFSKFGRRKSKRTEGCSTPPIYGTIPTTGRPSSSLPSELPKWEKDPLEPSLSDHPMLRGSPFGESDLYFTIPQLLGSPSRSLNIDSAEKDELDRMEQEALRALCGYREVLLRVERGHGFHTEHQPPTENNVHANDEENRGRIRRSRSFRQLFNRKKSQRDDPREQQEEKKEAEASGRLSRSSSFKQKILGRVNRAHINQIQDGLNASEGIRRSLTFGKRHRRSLSIPEGVQAHRDEEYVLNPQDEALVIPLHPHRDERITERELHHKQITQAKSRHTPHKSCSSLKGIKDGSLKKPQTNAQGHQLAEKRRRTRSPFPFKGDASSWSDSEDDSSLFPDIPWSYSSGPARTHLENVSASPIAISSNGSRSEIQTSPEVPPTDLLSGEGEKSNELVVEKSVNRIKSIDKRDSKSPLQPGDCSISNETNADVCKDHTPASSGYIFCCICRNSSAVMESLQTAPEDATVAATLETPTTTAATVTAKYMRNMKSTERFRSDGQSGDTGYREISGMEGSVCRVCRDLIEEVVDLRQEGLEAGIPLDAAAYVKLKNAQARLTSNEITSPQQEPGKRSKSRFISRIPKLKRE